MDNGWFWSTVTAFNAVALTTCLILLNMKWPAVLFVLVLAVCSFVFSNSRPWAKSASVAGAGLALYLLLSIVVLRWFPAPEDALAAQQGTSIGEQDAVVD